MSRKSSRAIYEHFKASGYLRYALTYHEAGEGWRGTINLATVPMLVADERFTCLGWPDYALHTEVGSDLIGFRSITGRAGSLGKRSLQLVISCKPVLVNPDGTRIGQFYADTDLTNPDQDLAGLVVHAGQVVYGGLKAIGGLFRRRKKPAAVPAVETDKVGS